MANNNWKINHKFITVTLLTYQKRNGIQCSPDFQRLRPAQYRLILEMDSGPICDAIKV